MLMTRRSLCWLLAVALGSWSLLLVACSEASSSLFQLNHNRQCVQLMNGATTMFAGLSADDLSPKSQSLLVGAPDTLHRDCADSCLHKDNCDGFNWPPSGRYCILVGVGCTLESSPRWSFYKKLKSHQIPEPGMPPTTTTDAVALTPTEATSRFTPLVNNSFSQIKLSDDSDDGSTLGSSFDVFQNTVCQGRLEFQEEVATRGEVLATCARLCLEREQGANKTCSGFSALVIGSFSPMCRLMLTAECDYAVQDNWYYFKRREPPLPTSPPPVHQTRRLEPTARQASSTLKKQTKANGTQLLVGTTPFLEPTTPPAEIQTTVLTTYQDSLSTSTHSAADASSPTSKLASPSTSTRNLPFEDTTPLPTSETRPGLQTGQSSRASQSLSTSPASSTSTWSTATPRQITSTATWNSPESTTGGATLETGSPSVTSGFKTEPTASSSSPELTLGPTTVPTSSSLTTKPSQSLATEPVTTTELSSPSPDVIVTAAEAAKSNTTEREKNKAKQNATPLLGSVALASLASVLALAVFS